VGKTTGPDDTPLGVAAGLGLPLQPKERGRLHRLPPLRADWSGALPLLDAPEERERLPLDVAASILTTQTGRIRLTTLLDEHLTWRRAQPLVTEALEIQALTPDSLPLPAVRIRPAQRGEEVRTRLTDERRITLRAEERQHLDIEETGARVLALVWLDDLSTVLVMGERALSHLLTTEGHAVGKRPSRVALAPRVPGQYPQALGPSRLSAERWAPLSSGRAVTHRSAAAGVVAAAAGVGGGEVHELGVGADGP